jgi:hypothetical protein
LLEDNFDLRPFSELHKEFGEGRIRHHRPEMALKACRQNALLASKFCEAATVLDDVTTHSV